jgi:nitrogen fixation NifU-like protein
MDVTQLYQDIILDHYREKHHAGLREPFDAEVHHVNPSCGDEIDLRVTLADNSLSDVSYRAVGCSISQASASVLADLVIGHPVAEAESLYGGFQAMMESGGRGEVDEERFEDAIAFHGVAQFPGRVKCAMLPWAAMKDALIRAGAWEGAEQ